MSKWFHNAPAGPGCDVLRRSTAKDVYRITGMDHGAIGGPRRYNNSFRTADEVLTQLVILDQNDVRDIVITHYYRKVWSEVSRITLTKKAAT